jgi:hypothetical protein
MWSSRDSAQNHLQNTRVCWTPSRPSSFTSRMRKTHRYSIKINNENGSIVFATVAVWDGHDRRAAVAKILGLDGVLEPPSFPSHRSSQDVATNIDLERMAALPRATVTPHRGKLDVCTRPCVRWLLGTTAQLGRMSLGARSAIPLSHHLCRQCPFPPLMGCSQHWPTWKNRRVSTPGHLAGGLAD